MENKGQDTLEKWRKIFKGKKEKERMEKIKVSKSAKD